MEIDQKKRAESCYSGILACASTIAVNSKNMRNLVYQAVAEEIHLTLGYKSIGALFKTITDDPKCLICRQTVNDYKNAAIVEIGLKLKQGDISVETLLALNKDTTEEERQIIFKRAIKRCKKESIKNPTKAMIEEERQRYKEQSASSEEDNEVQHDDSLSVAKTRHTKGSLDVEEKEAPPIRKPAIKQTDEEYQAEIDKRVKSKSNTKLKPKVDSDDIAETDDDNWISPKKYVRELVQRLGFEDATIVANMLLGVSKESLRIEYKNIRDRYSQDERKRVVDGIFAAID